VGTAARRRINGYQRVRRLDRRRWRELIRSGVAKIALFPDTCTLSFDCASAQQFHSLLEDALAAGEGMIAVTWLS
jgi:hypothetical protein